MGVYMKKSMCDDIRARRLRRKLNVPPGILGSGWCLSSRKFTTITAWKYRVSSVIRIFQYYKYESILSLWAIKGDNTLSTLSFETTPLVTLFHLFPIFYHSNNTAVSLPHPPLNLPCSLFVPDLLSWDS